LKDDEAARFVLRDELTTELDIIDASDSAVPDLELDRGAAERILALANMLG
jgi:hypothetical protein